MKLVAFTVLVGVCASALVAAEPLAWPQFRGPGGSGVADDQKPPVQIGPEKNVKWKVAAPSGLSSPIVAGDKLVITAFDGGKLYTIAYDRASGKEAWRAQAPAKQIEAYYKEGSPAASTPLTDGQRIISYFGSCGLVCYDLAGKELWKYDMPTATTPGDFGTGTSPTLADGIVVVVRDEVKNPRIVAVDAASGSFLWETKRRSVSSYCTPVIWDTPEGKQIAAAGHAQLVGYDLKTGAEKWSLSGMPSGCCSSPVVANGTLLFAGWSPGGPDSEFQMPTFDAVLKVGDPDKDQKLSRAESDATPFKDFFNGTDANKDGYVVRDEWDAVIKFMTEGKNSAFALKAGGTGDITTSHVLWKQTRGLPYIASAIHYRGQYVMVKDGGIVTAYDAQTGKDVYLMKRAIASGSYYASPVAAGGHIYFVSLADGVVTVLKAGTKEPDVVAENPPLGERVAATPAIADDTLYVRTEKHLYAFAAAK
ncbi:MAG: PQQ-binding-like beta-propeller repeat protein [Planctomycetaceae bacterium]|nr:PQQ-binding-like beta-propeller repeat protein [Planctomycetaceae bacterium]